MKVKVVNEHFVIKECPFCHPIKVETCPVLWLRQFSYCTDSFALGQGQEDNMWKLYVMRMNGTFKCFRCNSSGSWFDFQNKMVIAHSPSWWCLYLFSVPLSHSWAEKAWKPSPTPSLLGLPFGPPLVQLRVVVWASLSPWTPKSTRCSLQSLRHR